MMRVCLTGMKVSYTPKSNPRNRIPGTNCTDVSRGGGGWACWVSWRVGGLFRRAELANTAKSNTRNRSPRTNCADVARVDDRAWLSQALLACIRDEELGESTMAPPTSMH
eukprot:1462114-Rhodomonas_salina.1